MELESGHRTDKGIGYVALFGLLALAGAVGMFLAPGAPLGAAGFATAVLAGLVLVVVLHLYWA